MRRLRCLTGVLAAAGMLVAGVGCGDEESSPAGSGDSAQTTTGASGGGCDAGGAKVGLVLHVRIPFTQQIADGAQLAADECGADLQVSGPQNFDAPAQVSDFRNVIAAGAKAVVVVPQPAELWTRPITEAVDQGVVVAQTNVVAVDAKDAFFIGINGYDDNYALASEVAKKLGPDASGDVVAGTCSPGIAVLERRYDGVKAAFAKLAPDVNVKPQFDVTGDPVKNFEGWRQLVQANPNARAFIGLCAQDLPNLAKIKRAQAGAKYLIAGNDMEPDAIKALEDGIATATLDQNAFLQGYLPMRFVIAAITEQRALPKDAWIDSGFEVVTPDNVRELAPIIDDPAALREHNADYIDKVLADPESVAQPLAAVYGDRE